MARDYGPKSLQKERFWLRPLTTDTIPLSASSISDPNLVVPLNEETDKRLSLKFCISNSFLLTSSTFGKIAYKTISNTSAHLAVPAIFCGLAFQGKWDEDDAIVKVATFVFGPPLFYIYARSLFRFVPACLALVRIRHINGKAFVAQVGKLTQLLYLKARKSTTS